MSSIKGAATPLGEFACSLELHPLHGASG